ncbi:MAG: 6-carboxytetrahydropterin synthase [Candidatus Dormibacteraeota bacterium]|nr:6-carboxytetrahydropterin synthase [Candidatus Dormibacteraeota bacterium]
MTPPIRGLPRESGAVRLELARADIGFSAAHFSVAGGVLERLHGHNYRVTLRARGDVGAEGTLVDFRALKAALRAECALLDERMLVATQSDSLSVETSDAEVTVHGAGRRYVLPRDDVCLLPLRNTTCECLAAHLLQAVRHRLGELPARLEVGVEELPGQGAAVSE